MSRRKAFRVYLTASEPELKSWQELRDGGVIMNYRAKKAHDGRWLLFSHMDGRTTDMEHGNYLRTFGNLETLCTFLGVPVIGE